MASFNGGTQSKCKVCDKNVYAAEMIAARGETYHNTCFRCRQCNGRLALSNYSTMDGALYCNPHFEQMFKEKGVTVTRSQSLGKQGGEQLTKTQSKLSGMFSGTQEKCAACKKTVYPLEKVTVDGEFYHKSCFKCSHGGCILTTSNYAALDGLLYCKPHFSQLFKEKGSYNNLRKSNSLKANEDLSAVLPAADDAASAAASDPPAAQQEE
ncbi:PREDICTED: LIM domain-containing protein WLIM2b-like [Ipomoea nil]|uniref:LIM domain-containing protein WLIM2b-like n=1 Tax=Ipomoea nil TaxID=35883 RepID=UPI0009017AF8|nr:PREDICTED: LIM domain-containing protein WLIM2b-like [Ipomoea nil]